MSNTAGIKSHNALIIFTREPVPGKTKTRLMPYYSPEQCAELHRNFLRDYADLVNELDADIIVYSTGGEPAFIRETFGEAVCREQTGEGLGNRMKNAIAEVLAEGYSKVILIGSDIPELRRTTIEEAFDKLECTDVVLGPTCDGGYFLVGMRSLCESAFSIEKYGDSSVLERTVRKIRESGRSAWLVDQYADIDTREDLREYSSRMRTSGQMSHTWEFVSGNERISIILPVYNEEANIRSMMKQLTPYRNQAEIIFVDGGSTDKTLQIIGEKYRVIKSPKGRANQMNTGAEASTGDILFFLHCDSRIPPDITGEIRRCMMKNMYGCFGLEFDSKNFFMWTNKLISNHRAWRRGLPFGDQGIFIDRDLFFEMGGFPQLKIMEDYEFGLRLRAKGYKPGKTDKRIVTSARRFGKGTLSIVRTEYSMWKLRRLYRAGTDSDKIAEMYRDIR